MIEWYDFYLYGVLALFFSKHFFSPELSPTVAFIASLFVFWTGFLVRPFGAILFGHLGDLIGRKFTFMLTLGLMGAATFVVGLLPGYAVIGALAPILLVTMRVLQGLALGGEYGGAATYIAEHAPDGRRGFYTSWIQTTATMGIVLALLVILICRLSLGDQAFGDWGWRVPFLLSAILVLLSGYIRLRLEESPLFARLKEQGKSSSNPAADSFLRGGRNWGLMLIALFGATAPEGRGLVHGQFYALFYLTTVLKVNYVTVYIIMMIALTFGAPFFVVFGALSDRIGRRNIMTLGFALAVISYWPVFTWLGTFKDNPVDPDDPGVLHGDPGDDGVRPDRGVPGRAVSGAHPLHLDVAALSRRQRRLWRAGPGGRRLDRRDHRHRAERTALSDGDRRDRASSSASPSSANRRIRSGSGTRSTAPRRSCRTSPEGHLPRGAAHSPPAPVPR